MRNVAKRLKFPLLGVAKNLSFQDTTYPTENGDYATPMAVNVVGPCVFHDRLRGGSRPALKALSSQPSLEGDGKWLWPNGEPILWPNGDNMTFGELYDGFVLPDGKRIAVQHETFSVRASKGAVPEGCSVMAFYRARLVVAKDTLWYASRSGAVDDFDYGGDGEDVGRAASGNVALAARKGEAVTALVPVNDSVLFVCTDRAISMISGEPTNGTAKRISHEVGVISRDAWCFDSERIYFLGGNGLYAMNPGESPLLISGNVPKELKGVASATLLYDPDHGGIHIFAGDRGDWFYDLGKRAFWKLSYPVAIRPSFGGLAVIGGVNTPVFLCADGEWRRWSEEDDEDGEGDDAVPVESTVAIGPFRCGSRDDVDGMLDTITATLAEDSDDATVSVYTAHSAERAVELAEAGEAPESDVHPVKSGWNHVIRARKRGAWCVLVITASGRWAYESVLATIKVLGRLRP